MRPYALGLLPSAALAALLLCCERAELPAAAVPVPPPQPNVWKVEDLRPGMKGHGLTVMKGTKVESFSMEVLGVLRNTSPGRDLVLARLAGLGLEKSGVIAGMSGSPVYIDGKLVGAVAYAWAFGKEPIAGITPYRQMAGFVEALERREVAARPARFGLADPVRVGGREVDAVTVSQGYDDDAMLVPLRSPLAASGFTPAALRALSSRTASYGLVPMRGGTASARAQQEGREVALEPGGSLAVSLIRGDFDLSGIGTVTHVEGNRVYGWGHPFMSLGGCDLPMMTGHIHTIFPRLTVSFKMGSPLREVGVMHADVSTCIAGHIGKRADMLPVRMTVVVGGDDPRTFEVEVARHRTLMPTLAFTALVNSVDLEGELPDEMTAHLKATVEVEGADAVVIEDTLSGFSGSRAPTIVFGQVASALGQLTHNPHRDLVVKRVTCETRVERGRQTAEIEAVELDSKQYRPGDEVRATATLKPYKGARRKVPLRMRLPVDLPEGEYTATVCDEPTSARSDLRADPTLAYPTDAEQVLRGLRLLTAARRTTLALRVPVAAHGVVANSKALPNLPASMVHVMTNARRTGAAPMGRALVARAPTEWVIQGGEQVKLVVSKTKNVTRAE